MKISIIGTGYVGLVSGCCFAEMGHNVICMDVDEKKINHLNNKELPIFEPDLNVIFERNLNQKRIHFTTLLEKTIDFADVIFFALPTPPDKDGFADLKYIIDVAHQIGKLLKGKDNFYKVFVNKSTVPVGTANLVKNVFLEYLYEETFDVVSNPEFLREGYAVNDFLKPDRVVIGTRSPKAEKLMKKLYKPFTLQGNPVYVMDEKSSEMTKYAANSYLATRISFINEIANVCDTVGANVDNVRLGMGSDSRIGKRFLFPGIGYGGSCFPKDVEALIKTSDENNYEFKILNSVVEVNKKQKEIPFKALKTWFGDALKNKTIGIWGLSFKPDTDDIRETPAIGIIKSLLQEKVQKIKAFDPVAMENFKKHITTEIEYTANHLEAATGVDVLLILTEWRVFRNINLKELSNIMKDKYIFDGRNILDLEELKQLKFVYKGVGRSI